MIPVYQNHFSRGDDRGNCWHACIASIMERSVAQVPDTRFCTDGTWLEQAEEFALSQGWVMEMVSKEDSKEWGIALGKSPRGERGHAVVTFDGDLFHDPYPNGGGLDGEADTFFILKAQK